MTETETKVVHLPLKSSKTWGRRYANWYPGAGEPPRLGTLTIVQSHGQRNTDGSDVNSYGVEEDATAVPPGFRAFILRNDDPDPGDKARQEFYRVVCGEKSAGCSCIGTGSGRAAPGDCKHAAAIRALLAKEAL